MEDPRILNEDTPTVRMISRLYPVHRGNMANITNSYSIHFFSEGFASMYEFDIAVVKVWKQLISISPFNLIQDHKAVLSAYYYWMQPPNTEDEGPQLISAQGERPTGRTTYDSYIRQVPNGNSYDYFMGFDQSKFLESIEYAVVREHERNFNTGVPRIYRLKDYIVHNNSNLFHFQQNSINILLFPNKLPVGVSSNGIEVDLSLDPNPNIKLYMLSASSTSGKFIARAIAQAMGLHSESPYSSPQKTTPSTLEERMPFAYAPNLVYLPNISNPYIPNWDFKWYKDIESGNFLNGIRVHHLPSGISANKIDSPRVELWEGGGGFEKDVYRSAEFCLMNSTVGGPNKVENAHDHFCPVCTNYITNLLSRTNNNVFDGPVTLLNQPLKFDEVNWVNKTIYIENSNININQNFNNQPINVATEYWTFNLESNSSIGIRLSNIKVKNQQRPEVRITEEVMEFIEFENIKILFENEQEPVDFPISEVFSNNKAKLEVYENGNNLQYDNLFQKGVKLTMKHDFEGTCDVTVVLSVVFRGREHDFDPGGAAYAAKFYPQIQFSWSPTQNNPRKVKSFIGHIVMDCNTHHAETNPTCLPTKTNFLELFTDSNTLITSVDQHFRKHKYRIKPSTLTPDDQAVVNPISQWSFLFDYYRAMVNSSGYQDPFDKTWTVVYGPLNNKAKTSRSTAMSFINEFSSKVDNNFVVNKVPRQGAYDNVHVTGDMGFHQPQTGMGSEPYLYEGSEVLIPARLLAAPFCAEDCIHIHFRWGAIAKYLAAVMRSDVSQFKGWYPDLENSLKGSASEQPLVPPNQEIKLRAINTNNRSKKIIYEAEIIKPYAGSQNVIFEQGAAFALEVHSSFVTLGLKLFFSSSPIFPALCPDGIDGALTLDDYVFMRKVYSRIRFVEPIPNSGGPLQVRTGVPKASDTDSTLESL